MIIKSKADIQSMINDLKESGNTLSYETDNGTNFIHFNKEQNIFIVTINAKNTKFKLNGNYKESVLVEQLFIDRKYINKINRI